MSEPSVLEATFVLQLRGTRLDRGCEAEYVFAPPRRWRFDFAWPSERIAVELEGGVWPDRQGRVGRHVSSKGFEDDAEKYNAAAIAGWLVLRIPGRQVESGEALRLLERAFAARRAAAG